MTDNTSSTPRVQELSESLEKLDRSTTKLDEVLNALFEVFSERGIKPTPHLQQARESVKKHVKEAQDSSKHVQSQITQFGQLVRTTALITSSLDIEKVLEEVMDTVIDLTGAERAYLMLYDDKRELHLRAARNWDQQSLSESEVGISRTIINTTIEGGKAIITTNAQADSRFENKDSIMVQKLRSIMCIPLALGGKTVGVLYTDNRLQRDVFQEDMVPLLTAFGTQAAIAISNAQLFGQVKENLEEAERVIHDLKIEVDKGRVDKAVSEITETEYFQSLAATANLLRQRFKAPAGHGHPHEQPAESADAKPDEKQSSVETRTS
jgi:adenylate cyclase